MNQIYYSHFTIFQSLLLFWMILFFSKFVLLFRHVVYLLVVCDPITVHCNLDSPPIVTTHTNGSKYCYPLFLNHIHPAYASW
jgi:hypothetical protein